MKKIDTMVGNKNFARNPDKDFFRTQKLLCEKKLKGGKQNILGIKNTPLFSSESKIALNKTSDEKRGSQKPS